MTNNTDNEPNPYLAFQGLDDEEFQQLFRKIGSDATLAIPKDLYYFVKTAISQKSINKAKTIVYLEDIPPNENADNVFVPCTDDPDMLTYILNKLGQFKNYKKTIVMIPRYSPSCQSAFENNPQSEGIQVLEFHAEILPLSGDRFVLPVPLAYSNIYCDSDISDVQTIARGLLKLQLVLGAPEKVYCAGAISHRVYSLMEELKKHIGHTFYTREDSVYDEIFIFDRSVDNVTPMMIQPTYGGRIDEDFNPSFGFFEPPEGVSLVFDPRIKPKQDPNVEVIVPKDSNLMPKNAVKIDALSDPVYKEICDLMITDALTWMQEFDKERLVTVPDMLKQTKGTNEWRKYSKRATELLLQSPYNTFHFNLFEKIPLEKRHLINQLLYKDQLIMNDEPIEIQALEYLHRGLYTDAIKMLALSCVYNNGASQATISKFESTLNAVFGASFAWEWIRLNQANLIYPKSLFGGKPFINAKRDLEMVLPMGDQLENFYGGFVPLIVRLVEHGLKNGWGESSLVGKTMKSLGIPFSTNIPVNKETLEKRTMSTKKDVKSVLVFAIGGMTHSEMAMLEALGKKVFNGTVDFHNGTTDLTCGSRLIQQICPSLKKNNN